MTLTNSSPSPTPDPSRRIAELIAKKAAGIELTADDRAFLEAQRAARVPPSLLAKRWKVTAGRVSQLIALGMPTDSIEAAEAWRKARASTSRGTPQRTDEDEPITVDPSEIAGAENTTLEESLKEHRRLSAIAQRRWAKAQERSAPDEQRLFKIYQDSKAGEMKIERTVLAQKLEAKELVKIKDVFADLAKVLAEIRNDVRGIGIEVAPTANPDDPGLALKTINAKTNKLLKKWSTVEADALERLSEAEPAEPNGLQIAEDELADDAE